MDFDFGAFRDSHFLYSAKISCLAFLAAWLVSGIFLEDLLGSALASLPVFFIALAAQLYAPKMKKQAYAKKVEACLPFALMDIALQLNLGLPFIAALENAGRGKGPCSKEMERVFREVKTQGASVEDALKHFSERSGSRLVKRGVTQMLASFEKGQGRNAGYPVKRIAREMLSRQRVEAKMFSGKMVVTSLLFIAVSAIVPAIFQSFAIVGSVLLKMSFTPAQLFLVITVLFPGLDLAVLLFIKSKTPAFMRAG